MFCFVKQLISSLQGDIWGCKQVSIRLNKQENNDNRFFVSGNTPDLGDFKHLIKMDLIKKKSFLIQDESYWEKNILIPSDFPSNLLYNFYELDKENKCILVNEMNFSVNVFDDLKFPSFEKLWSPQIFEKRISNFKQMTINHPFKLIKQEIKNHMRIDINTNKPKRIEKKYNSLHLFNELKPLKSFLKEINKEFIIGKSF